MKEVKEENDIITKEENQEPLQERIETANEVVQDVIEEKVIQEELEEVELNEPVVAVLENENKEEIIEEFAEEINPKPKEHLKKYPIIITIVSVILLIGLAIFSTVFALSNKNSNTIVNGIFIKGIDVSGLTKEQALSKLNEVFVKQAQQVITLQHNDYQTTLIPQQIQMSFGLEETVNIAYDIGRTGKILKDNYAILNANLSKLNIEPADHYSEEELTNFIYTTQESLPDIVKQSGYSIDGNNLIISKGEKGSVIQEEELKNKL